MDLLLFTMSLAGAQMHGAQSVNEFKSVRLNAKNDPKSAIFDQS
jgi:hypothetical protein